MKIRTQIYILLAGIIIIPSLAFVGLQVVNQHRWNQFKAAAQAERTQYMEQVRERLQDGPPPVMFPEGPKADASEGDQVADDQVIDSQVTDLDGVPARERGKQKNRFRPTTPPPPRMPWFQIMGVALGIVFLLCAVVMTSLARSIGRSVTQLGEATKRIAGGDLDTPVDIKGSNEISALSRSLDAMRESLKEAQNRRSRFIMGVSHDLRTPLALIKGYTEALGDGTVDSRELRERAQSIIASKIEQLQEMIDDLIDVVRFDSGEWRQHLKPHRLLPLLTAFHQRLVVDGTLLKRTITGTIAVGADVTVPLDERLFTRMLENLTGNALRYTKEGGRVDFSAKMAEGKKVQITITDNGCGIPKKEMPFIFDTFYRGSNSRREEGRGFGLSIVKSVADSYGWPITAASTEGEGSTFTITIPIN
jgi:signal transduction histidine kinase